MTVESFIEKHSSLAMANDEEEGFMGMTPGVKVIKLFSFIADDEA
jgi:hypothetical protein